MRAWARTIKLTAVAPDALRALEQHRALQQELRDQGVLKAVWQFEQAQGFLEILETEDRTQAEELNEKSPLIQGGWCVWALEPVKKVNN